MTVLGRTLAALAAAAAPAARIAAAGDALAPLLAEPIARLAAAEATGTAEAALVEALAGHQAPADAEAPLERSPRPALSARKLALDPARSAPARPRSEICEPSARTAIELEPASPLRRIAARVPGGTAAASTPIAIARGERTAEGAASAAAKSPAGAEVARPAPAATPAAGPAATVVATVAANAAANVATPAADRAAPAVVPAARSARPVASIPGLTPAAASRSMPPSTAGARAALEPRPSREPGGIRLLGAAPPAGGGLAQLARMWRDHETAASGPPDLPAPASRQSGASSPEPGFDPLATEMDAMDAFGRAIERVLVGEARRHGIPLDDP
ncbi:MAG TPA: hypothetical protein VKB80_35515 [Kofleriaceae bacterium]|nr:hypothetical protein [Kofleriaceae bacterium]